METPTISSTVPTFISEASKIPDEVRSCLSEFGRPYDTNHSDPQPILLRLWRDLQNLHERLSHEKKLNMVTLKHPEVNQLTKDFLKQHGPEYFSPRFGGPSGYRGPSYDPLAETTINMLRTDFKPLRRALVYLSRAYRRKMATEDGSMGDVAEEPSWTPRSRDFSLDEFEDDDHSTYVNVGNSKGNRPWVIRYVPGENLPYGTVLTEPRALPVVRRRLRDDESEAWFVHYRQGNAKHWLPIRWMGCGHGWHLEHLDGSVQKVVHSICEGIPLNYIQKPKRKGKHEKRPMTGTENDDTKQDNFSDGAQALSKRRRRSNSIFATSATERRYANAVDALENYPPRAPPQRSSPYPPASSQAPSSFPYSRIEVPYDLNTKTPTAVSRDTKSNARHIVKLCLFAGNSWEEWSHGKASVHDMQSLFKKVGESIQCPWIEAIEFRLADAVKPCTKTVKYGDNFGEVRGWIKRVINEQKDREGEFMVHMTPILELTDAEVDI
ncbi:hypothetical protein MMC13_000504 [Lambiella insularis]|nr:hypothetical protein [Lambiella insularis]